MSGEHAKDVECLVLHTKRMKKLMPMIMFTANTQKDFKSVLSMNMIETSKRVNAAKPCNNSAT